MKTQAGAGGRSMHVIYEKNPCSFNRSSGSLVFKHGGINFNSTSFPLVLSKISQEAMPRIKSFLS